MVMVAQIVGVIRDVAQSDSVSCVEVNIACMRDFPHHYSIMYYFTPPIFSCLLNILLLFVRTISP